MKGNIVNYGTLRSATFSPDTHNTYRAVILCTVSTLVDTNQTPTTHTHTHTHTHTRRRKRTHVDVKLHILPLAEASELVTVRRESGERARERDREKRGRESGGERRRVDYKNDTFLQELKLITCEFWLWTMESLEKVAFFFTHRNGEKKENVNQSQNQYAVKL